MPDILIRGISLDDCFGKTIEIGRDADGHVFVYVDNGETAVLDVAELPPHGDLIDRDAILNAEKTKPIAKMMMFGGAYVIDLDVVRDAPVVVPAERSDADA